MILMPIIFSWAVNLNSFLFLKKKQIVNLLFELHNLINKFTIRLNTIKRKKGKVIERNKKKKNIELYIYIFHVFD